MTDLVDYVHAESIISGFSTTVTAEPCIWHWYHDILLVSDNNLILADYVPAHGAFSHTDDALYFHLLFV